MFASGSRPTCIGGRPPEPGPVTVAELTDRLAIRTLVDAYAHCADRRDADGQKALFTEDTHFVVYMDGEGTEPSQESMAARR